MRDGILDDLDKPRAVGRASDWPIFKLGTVSRHNSLTHISLRRLFGKKFTQHAGIIRL